MAYLTTKHKFIIDEQHPADVFAEMANFFSLYTVAIDSLQRMSIQLCVPKSFAIADNQTLHDGYQQFIKTVRYTISDINILPVQTLEDNTNQNDMLTLMVQYYEGRLEENSNTAGNITVATETTEPKPKFYQKILGGLLPKFANEKSFDGLYPEPIETRVTMPEPIAQKVANPTPAIVPPVTSVPVASPAQPTLMPKPARLTSIPTAMPTPAMPQMPVSQSPIQPPSRPQMPAPSPMPSPTPTPKILGLPKPSKSIQPYRQLLTQAIVAQIQTESLPKLPCISKITFKSRDSLTTAFIETVFASFQVSPAHATPMTTLGRAYDAIDLVSYGLEELRPQLATLNVTLAEDAQFLLNSKAHARPEDLGLIQQGQLDPSQLRLGVQLAYTTLATPATKPINPLPTHQNLQSNPPMIQPNSNPFNIALTVKVSDSLGERAVKLTHFPAIVTSESHKSNPNSTLIKVLPNGARGQFFIVNEQDGHLVVQQLSPNVAIYRNAQPLHNGDTLLPHDVIRIGQDGRMVLLPV